MRLLFQPAEEGGAGGDAMVKEGEERCDAAFAAAAPSSMLAAGMRLSCGQPFPPTPAGALEGVKAAFGMHVWPALPSGMIASRPGTLLAGAIQFDVKVKGRGGHAAMPHLTIDPVLATTAVVGAVQALVSRETSPFESAVISVTRLAGGGAYNVVPDEGAFWGGMWRRSRGSDALL